ncbi:MAG: TonB-dependent receptor [Bacteroidales bacterium]|nr:TonB-dependent receptor [Bacteroidales bacterium]
MQHKTILFLLAGLCVLQPVPVRSQEPPEKRDTLDQAVFVARGNANFLSKHKDLRTEVITAAGLCKMACCNLAESFENSASVTVGYSDAVTGARQIRLLGQNGIYTQMLDENRPVMRGLAAPFGLNYVPGQWLESIQIAKGVTSVVNGVESMTGQINLEHRKPTDEIPLFVQASVMNDTKTDFNVASSLQLDKEGKWSTVFLGHFDGNFKEMDHNDDGFMDDPRQRQFSFSNRWLYQGFDGSQVRFGVRGIADNRQGGQMSGDWTTDIRNSNLGAYLKAGIPLNEENTSNIALVADYTWYRMDGDFTTRRYDARQHSAFLNLLYQNHNVEQHHFTLGLGETLDFFREKYLWGAFNGDALINTTLNNLGAFGEYTFHSADETTFSAIVGLRADWFKDNGVRFSPRLTLKWAPSDSWVFRANGGRGLRYSNPISDNIGVLSTGKQLLGPYTEHILEDSWTFGGNATWYIGGSSTTYLSFDYFRTQFREQMLVENGPDSRASSIVFSPLTALKDGYSYTDNFQVDFSTEPLEGLTLTLTGRFTNARQKYVGTLAEDDIKPMTSRYKGVLNAQYATHLNKWIFDFTASINGPCKVWEFMKGYKGMYSDGWTPVYPLLYAQVTRRFKGFDLYLGGENLTNYRQQDPILYADQPFSTGFDASCVWGPLMGIRVYGGVRITLWKTVKE